MSPLPIYVTSYRPTPEPGAWPEKTRHLAGSGKTGREEKLRSARVAGYGRKGFVTDRNHEEILQPGHSHRRNLYQGRPGLLAYLNR